MYSVQRTHIQDPVSGHSFWCLFHLIELALKSGGLRVTWVAQSVKRLTSAQVMNSQFVGLSPASGSVLTAQSLEPALDSVSPSLSAPPPLMLCLYQKMNKHLKKRVELYSETHMLC